MNKVTVSETELITIIKTMISEQEGTAGGGVEAGTSDAGGTGAKGGLRKGISSWVERKRIQFRDKKGRFISYKRTSFLISRSIYRTGIRPSLFFTKPFEQAFAKLPDDLIRAYSVGIEKQLNVTIKEK